MRKQFIHWWHTNRPAVFAGAISIVTLIAVAWHLVDRYRYIRSDDALVQAHFTTLTAKVPGIVDTIYVREMEHVKKGELLAKIDDSDFRYRYRKQASALESSRILKNLQEKDLARDRALHRDDAISDQDFDLQKTAYQKSLAQETGELAHLTNEEIELDYTEIRAPADGILAGRAISVGTLLSPGDPLYGFVDPKTKWIDARIKETDLADLKVGQEATVEIDAIPGKEFKGRVESVGGSTEGIQAEIPPDNAAGNYTKYVQRIPVRVALELTDSEQEEVRVGLSAKINIRRVHD